MKPLSKKSLERKYAELGLSKEKTDLLHTYFLCFAHLYGVISVREAWDVFRHYEGAGVVRRKDFAAFHAGLAEVPEQVRALLAAEDAALGVPVLWLITEDGAEPPWGICVRL